jgi:hypothetical protein
MQGRPPHFPGSMVIRSAYDIRREFNPLPGYRKTPWLQPGEWPMEFDTFDVIGNCRFGLGRVGSKRIVAIHDADRRPPIAIAFRVPYAFQSKESESEKLRLYSDFILIFGLLSGRIDRKSSLVKEERRGRESNP